MSACVLPIAPEFQDPPAAANFAPEIIDSDPPIGKVVIATPTTIPTFRITVTDPNVGDNLHVRWLADFPPFSSNTRILQKDSQVTHSSNGTPLNQDVKETPSCLDNLANVLTHPITVIVADRPFLDAPAAPGVPVDITALVGDDGHKVIASWPLQVECQ